MNQQAQLYGLVGGVIGLSLGVLIASYSVNNNATGMMRMMGMNTGRIQQNMMDEDTMDHMGFSMEDMVNLLQGKSGDQFDAAFIDEMIDHHQGAIDMAQLAKQNAKHDEIKQMADDIISAQTSEIEQMREWRSQWGY